MSPITLALRLLLQNPKLLCEITLPTNFQSIKLEGMDLLKKIIHSIDQNSQQNTGSLLEYFKEDAEKQFLIELATQDLLIPEDAWQKELQGAVNRLLQLDIERQIQSILTRGNQAELSLDEKRLLQKLLVSRV